MRSCDFCGVEYQPKRSTSRYHSPSCRAQAAKARAEGRVVPIPPPEPAPPDGLVGATTSELVAVERLETSLGQQALALASRIATGHDSGSSIAALSKELRAVMEAALSGAAEAVDPVDELGARRDLKRAAAR